MEERSARRAVVTGGGSGIGESIVCKLSQAGIRTASCDIRSGSREKLPGFFVRTDLTRGEEIDLLYDRVMEEFGHPDILICNAGRGVHEKLTEGNPEIWEEIFRLNVFGTFRLIRAFVPKMIEKGRGDVVFISSVSSRSPYPYGGIYSASKAAVDRLAETLRLETLPDVRVTVIHPGVVDTSFFENIIHGSQTVDEIGWGALSPEDVAEAVLYAITRPPGVVLNDIVMRPNAQPM